MPDGMQRLLNTAHWDADQVRDDLQQYPCKQPFFEEPSRSRWSTFLMQPSLSQRKPLFRLSIRVSVEPTCGPGLDLSMCMQQLINWLTGPLAIWIGNQRTRTSAKGVILS
jgi:hypothetical protein